MADRETVPPGGSLPSVSVIVPIYNVARTLPTTLPAWIGQDYPAEWLLVDDGSTDGTRALLEVEVAGQPSVRLLRHEENRGRAAARNTGIEAATGDVLLFLDADMRPEPDFVRQHAMLHRDTAVAGAVSHAVLEGLDPSDPYHRYLESRRGAKAVGPERPLPFKYFIIGYTSVKAHVVREVGGFDERLSYGEDLDFAYRIAQRYPDGLRYSNRPVVHHYDHGSLDDRIAKLCEFGQGNLPLLLAKHPGLARAANVDFVDSPDLPSTVRRRLQRAVLQPSVASAVRSLLRYVPESVSDVLVRYVLAVTIAEAYRSALAPEPH